MSIDTHPPYGICCDYCGDVFELLDEPHPSQSNTRRKAREQGWTPWISVLTREETHICPKHIKKKKKEIA